jgi:hypothetical protein
VYVNETGTDRFDPMKDPGLAAQIRNELQSSNDIALVGLVAWQVDGKSNRGGDEPPGNWDFNALRILATEQGSFLPNPKNKVSRFS